MVMMNLKKNISFASLLILISLVLGCDSLAKQQAYQDIDVNQAAELIKTKPVLILDIRTPEEYREVHIKDSVLIPLQDLEKEYVKISDHIHNPVLIYCRSGNRSVTATHILLSKGFNNLYNMKGGIKEWIKHQFPVETRP